MTEVVTSFTDNQGRAVTAAAQILAGPKIQRGKRPTNKGLPWQQQAWDYVDQIGEFSWSVELLATHVSKVQLVAARDIPGQDEPVTVGIEYERDGETQQPTKLDLDAAELVSSIAGGTAGQQQLMYRSATQEIVAAESFVVVRPNLDTGELRWDSYSNEEIRFANGGWQINDGTEIYDITDNDILIRIWRPHPRKRSEPRSSTLPLLPVLAEIKGLTQAIAARIDSRLAGAGVLFVPESLSLMTAPGADTDGKDPFVAELMQAMLTAIRDRDSAAAVVPIVVRIPDEAVGKIQHVRFEITTTAEEAAQRQDAVLRMARAVDLPPEQILGMSGMNHWGAWQADLATVKGPVTTLAAVICHGLTVGYLRPALLELGHSPEDVADVMVWFDVTDLVQREDRSAQATAAFENDALGYSAYLRESGFDEADAPTEEDTCRKLLFTLVKADPAAAAEWIRALGPCAGINIDLPDIVAPTTVREAVTPGAPDAAAPQPDQQAPPATQNDQPPALAASSAITEPSCPDPVDCLYNTCEVAVFRALELAGKRMRGSSPRNERSGLLSIPAHELHTNVIVASQLPKHGLDTLLQDAWSPLRLTLGQVPEPLLADLDLYVRDLISRQERHDPDQLRAIVAEYA